MYQLGADASNQLNTFKALKEGQQNTEPPAATEDNTAAINPWMWNSGIIFIHLSEFESDKVAPMCFAEEVILTCDSGTIFGRDVVPEVCNTKAMSSGSAMPPAMASEVCSPINVKDPAGSVSDQAISITFILRDLATSIAGELLFFSTINALAPRSER